MTEWGSTHRTQSEPCGLRPALATMMVALLFVLSPPADADPQSSRQRGQSDGLWYWDLPATPNGLRPLISYSGAGSAPGGTIYVGGMDHVSNSALYRLPGAGSTSALPAPTLSYLGDARAASEAAGNYLTGEGIEKFHTRPTWYGGWVFVANLNNSTQSAAYLNKRGIPLVRIRRGRWHIRGHERERAWGRGRTPWRHREHRRRCWPRRDLRLGVAHRQSLRLRHRSADHANSSAGQLMAGLMSTPTVPCGSTAGVECT